MDQRSSPSYKPSTYIINETLRSTMTKHIAEEANNQPPSDIIIHSTPIKLMTNMFDLLSSLLIANSAPLLDPLYYMDKDLLCLFKANKTTEGG